MTNVNAEVDTRGIEQALEEATEITHPENGKARSPDPSYPKYRVEPGSRVKLADVDPDESEHYASEDDGLEELERQRERIRDLQERLFAEEKHSLLIVLQAMDAGGKDGVGRGVFRGVNVEGCYVWSFKEPTPDEERHDFLWRFHHKVPETGMIAVFNRSYYEAVLSDRVKENVSEEVWRARYEHINQFERLITLNSTTVLKFYLHISKDEQKRRLEERINNPKKQWLFSENDLKARTRWDDYMAAFEDAINICSTEYAPWYVVPGNKKWYRNLVIARTIADTLDALDPQYPPLEMKPEEITIPD